VVLILTTNRIYNKDCLEGVKELADKSIDLVIIDPPYFKVMIFDWKGQKYLWDKQWDTLQDYLAWIGTLGTELKRVLKDNGSFYIFADDKISAYVQVELDKLFNLENNIIWVKPNNMTIKGWSGYRSYAPITERILFYSKETKKTGLQEIYENPDCFKSIKEYMRTERKQIMLDKGFKTQEEFNDYINHVSETASVVSRHYFPDSQWVFPTEDIYKKLQTTGYFQRRYEELRREYEELRREYEELRRYFKSDNNFTDVWTFNIMGSKESVDHPTQKPLNLIKRIVKTSSKEGMLILDCCMGSGTTAVACQQLGRNFIGFEIEPKYIQLAEERLKQKVLLPLIINTQEDLQEEKIAHEGIPPNSKE